MFTHDEYDALRSKTFVEIEKLGRLKGAEYAGDVDCLANFRRNGEALGLPMEVIWHTYAAKHFDAITQSIKDQLQGKTRQRLESLEGRADDLIVYLILFKAMLAERNRQPETDQPNLRERFRATAYNPEMINEHLRGIVWDALEHFPQGTSLETISRRVGRPNQMIHACLLRMQVEGRVHLKNSFWFVIPKA